MLPFFHSFCYFIFHLICYSFCYYVCTIYPHPIHRKKHPANRRMLSNHRRVVHLQRCRWGVKCSFFSQKYRIYTLSSLICKACPSRQIRLLSFHYPFKILRLQHLFRRGCLSGGGDFAPPGVQKCEPPRNSTTGICI